MKNCPICNSPTTTFYLTLYDDRYGYPGDFQLFKCHDCKHKFLDSTFTPEALVELYSKYYPRSKFDPEKFQPHIEAKGFHAWLDGSYRSAFRWVPKNVKVLDIGCGYGQTLAYHTSRGCEAHGVETDKNLLKVAEKFGFNVHIGVFDASLYEASYFDFVTLDQVIEHVVDPKNTLKDVTRVLKSGGIAILSTPNANGWGTRCFQKSWINWHAPYHLHQFSYRSFRLAAESAGLQLTKHLTITPSEWLNYQWIHLITKPENGEHSPFWSKRIFPTIAQQRRIDAVSLLHKYKINHVITRVFDALGYGDNHLFFLRKP